jgi:hypothetical protein
MRTALCMAIGLAVVVRVVPASFAQAPRVLGHGKLAGTGTKAEQQQTHDELSRGLRLEARDHTGISLAVPIGRVWVGPEVVDGEPSYVRRTKASEGMTIVEVSTTPFMPESPGVAQLIVRPDQPASW